MLTELFTYILYHYNHLIIYLKVLVHDLCKGNPWFAQGKSASTQRGYSDQVLLYLAGWLALTLRAFYKMFHAHWLAGSVRMAGPCLDHAHSATSSRKANICFSPTHPPLIAQFGIIWYYNITITLKFWISYADKIIKC